MTLIQIESALRNYALAFPEAYEDFPWGERVVKVRKKVFLFMGASERAMSLTVKLPASHDPALSFPFTQPTGYGLGNSGWITARFDPDDDPPIETLEAWIDESYRAIAPKKLVKLLDGVG
jgi:predicted DNA-binding protein (MmcQ/YjbR family)